MALDKGYVNSKIECAICGKHLSKNYMLTHLKSRHSNCYGTEFWNRYSDKYKRIVEDNKKLFSNSNKECLTLQPSSVAQEAKNLLEK